MNWDGAACACRSVPCRSRFLLLSLHSPSLNPRHFAGHMAHFQPTFLSTEGISPLLSYIIFPGTDKVEQLTVGHVRISLQTLGLENIQGTKKYPKQFERNVHFCISANSFRVFFFCQACIMLNHCFLSKSK